MKSNRAEQLIQPDINDITGDVGFRRATPIETGIQRFVDWYREYYGV